MNESANGGRMSDIVEAEQTIRVLSSELLKHKANSDKWRIEFSVNLAQDVDGKYTVEIAGKTGTRGHRLTLTNEEVQKYAVDPETIANHIADVMLGRILVEVAREELAPQVVKAIKNANQISGKSSL